MNAPEDVGFSRLSARITQVAGLAADAYKPRCLRRRIAVRMRAHNVTSYEAYLAILENTPDELQKLSDALTINVTKFFRNIELWQRLRDSVLPDLWLEGNNPLRVWSAGCASGEEPYSLAMLFAETSHRAAHPEWMQRLAIDATDIDRVCLERAKAGVYPQSAFTETPPDLLSAYTEPAGDDRRKVRDEVRRVVQVNRLDLTNDAPRHSAYSMIVCRNVLIYFDRPMQERLFAIFATTLRPGGILVLGKVETILGPTRDRLDLVDARERIYRRPV
ncbi:MAG: protein-glutamate O-methyltransferase CheR [Gemmatimonadota bacterium]